jgi:hypothetical protein
LLFIAGGAKHKTGARESGLSVPHKAATRPTHNGYARDVIPKD